MSLDREEQFVLPDDEAGMQALVDELIPPWRGRSGGQSAADKAERQRVERRRVRLMATLRMAARNAVNAADWRKASVDARRERDEAGRDADRRVEEAEDKVTATIRKFQDLMGEDRAIMLMLVQLVLAANGIPPNLQLTPADLKLEHGDAAAEARFRLGDHSLTISGVDVLFGTRMTLRGTRDGLAEPEVAGAYAFMQAVAARGAVSVDELSRQLAILIRAGTIGELHVPTGCGQCDACSQLAVDLAAATSIAQAVAAYGRKAGRPCPQGTDPSCSDKIGVVRFAA